jgi:chitinase
MSSEHVALRLRPAVYLFLAALLCVVSFQRSDARKPAGKFLVIAYVHGSAADLSKYPLQHLTHMNYCFLRLKGNRLVLHGERDSVGISRLVALKKDHPGLKILLSVGGWGGCEPCSDVFSTAEGRREFTQSAKEILVRFGADGIDMDWEYPAVEGYPGHKFAPEDRPNFTALIQEMRAVFGDRYEITFAAGGFGAANRTSHIALFNARAA